MNKEILVNSDNKKRKKHKTGRIHFSELAYNWDNIWRQLDWRKKNIWNLWSYFDIKWRRECGWVVILWNHLVGEEDLVVWLPKMRLVANQQKISNLEYYPPPCFKGNTLDLSLEMSDGGVRCRYDKVHDKKGIKKWDLLKHIQSWKLMR